MSVFYINYVVCKYSLCLTIPIISPCFILTMWYVNLRIDDNIYNKLKGFILTMWYVNLFIALRTV